MRVETIVLGAGCFWCAEAFFREVKGVCSVTSGFSGGTVESPIYKDICAGITGHAEAISIEYDTEIISYEGLLVIYFLMYDSILSPSDRSAEWSQYRSVIFYKNDMERKIAKKVKENMQLSIKSAVNTQIKAFDSFYEAPLHHQNYYNKNRGSYYCQVVITPILKTFHNLKDEWFV